jgi:hypothetical protein
MEKAMKEKQVEGHGLPATIVSVAVVVLLSFSSGSYRHLPRCLPNSARTAGSNQVGYRPEQRTREYMFVIMGLAVGDSLLKYYSTLVKE